jgi:CheY-like chemotaxis protein
MELDIKPHSPFEEYSQVLELFASMCAEKSVKPIAFVDPNLPSQIYADEIRLKQVLTNLLSNAVKFTNVYGFVKFDFRSEIISGHICKLLVSVSDNGIGMSEDTMSRLFNPFSQADNSTTRRYGGTGLGLSISKSLLNMMGSDINVKSQLGQGSEFSFEVEVDYDNSEPVWDIPENLRVALIANDFNDDLELFMEYMHSFGVNVSFISTFPKADEFDLFALHIDELTPTALMHTDIMHKCIIISGTQITTESLSNMLSPPFLPEKIFKLIKSILNMDEEVVPEVTTKPQFSGNVLIVDDNDVNVVLMQSILDEYGVKHVSAFDGCEAFKKYSENKFDLVLMDIHMPKCDGIMGLKLIRGLEVEKSLVKVPIVALTADAIKGKKDEMLAAGFDYYVTKPVSTESLESLFSKVLQQGEPIVITRKNDKKAIENIFFSSKKVAEELGIAEEGIIRSYEQFVRSAKESIVILRDAIESGNKELTRDVAHKIKGAAANLRIHIVSEATKIIEDDIFEKEESEIMNELTKIEGVITMLG